MHAFLPNDRPGIVRRLLWICALVVGLGACEEYLTQPEVGAGGPTVPVRLTFFGLAPDSVDVTSGSASLAVQVGARGDGGVDVVEVVLDTPGAGTGGIVCRADDPASGSPTEGIWGCGFTFNSGSSLGRWTVQRVRLEAAGREPIELTVTDLQQAGYPTGFTVVRDAAVPTEILIEPDGGVLTGLDDRLPLSATILNQYGEVMPEVVVTWSSADPSIAAVDGSGVVRPVLPGSTEVIASTGEIEARVPVTVSIVPEPVRIEVSPPEAVVDAIGTPVPFTAVVYDQFERPFEVALVEWSIVDPSIASVDVDGVARGVFPGTTGVVASYQALADTALFVVDVQRVPTTVIVTPASATLELGQSLQLAAVVEDQFGVLLEEVTIDWSSTDPTVATASDGLVSAIAPGTTTIEARAGDAVGTAEIEVGASSEIARIVVTPETVELNEIEAQQTFTATAFDAVDTELTEVTFDWSVADPSVASIDQSGLAIALGNGSTTVQASAGGVVGTGELTVAIPRRASSVTVAPDPVLLFGVGSTASVTASVIDQFGDPYGIPVTWSSSDESVFTVDGDGVVTAVGAGSGVVTASVDGASGSAGVTVEDEGPVLPELSGAIVFASERTGPRLLYRRDFDAQTVDQLTSGFDEGEDPVWSPDGSRILFTRDQELWLMNADGSGQTQLTTGGTRGGGSWSPDGRRIAYADGTDGDWDTYILNLADPSNPTVVLDSPDNDRYVDWSPDGTTLAYNRDDVEIRLVGVDGTGDRQLLSASTRYVEWSPSGTTIAYSRFGDGGWHIETVDVASGTTALVTPVSPAYDWGPTWSPDGAYLAFHRNGVDPDLFSDVFDILLTDREGTSEFTLEESGADDLVGDWTASIGTFGAPTATIIAPEGDVTIPAGSALALAGTASDPEDGTLSGAALEWRSDLDGFLGSGGSTLTAPLSIGVHQVVLTAVDRGGRVGADTVVVTVQGDDPPTVTIEAPADPTFVAPGTTVFFEGSATDEVDGDLSASLEWSSDLDGALGTGASVSSTLSTGTHVVTASVRDSGGNLGSASLSVTVADQGSTGALYGVDSSADALFRLDPASGAARRIGELLSGPFGVSDYQTPVAMAVVPETEQVLVWNNSPSSQLLDVDVCTGVASPIDTYSRAQSVGGLAYRSDGFLFVFDDDELLRLRLSDGTLDVIGPVGIRMAGAAFTPDGRLFGIELTLNAVVRLVEIDPETAEVVQSFDITGPGGGALTPGLAGSLTWNPATGQFLATAGRNYEGLDAAIYDLSTTGVATNARPAAGDGLQGIGFRSVPACAGESPTLSIDVPADGATLSTDVTRFEGTATDPEDGTISSSIRWLSDRDGFLGQSSGPFAALSEGTHTITATVQDSDGNPAEPQRVTVTVVAAGPPTVTIIQPSTDPFQVTEGTSITFQAEATDPVEGDLSTSIDWISDIDGVVGQGASITVTLSPGTHVITAFVEDSNFQSGLDTITVEVVVASPVPPGPSP